MFPSLTCKWEDMKGKLQVQLHDDEVEEKRSNCGREMGNIRKKMGKERQGEFISTPKWLKLQFTRSWFTIPFHSVISYSHKIHQRTNTQKLKYLPASWETPQEHICSINSLPGRAGRTTSVFKTVSSQMSNMNLLITGMVWLRNHRCRGWDWSGCVLQAAATNNATNAQPLSTLHGTS